MSDDEYDEYDEPEVQSKAGRSMVDGMIDDTAAVRCLTYSSEMAQITEFAYGTPALAEKQAKEREKKRKRDEKKAANKDSNSSSSRKRSKTDDNDPEESPLPVAITIYVFIPKKVPATTTRLRKPPATEYLEKGPFQVLSTV
ncbi:hypothetical protein B0H13DRAFT_1855854 [Mycena leptocephala]|nr:hypothetical protein B0H13DRAFT_1855854 [Mycena leptocephala]